MNLKLQHYIERQIRMRESDLTIIKSTLKHASEKAESCLDNLDYSYGYWFGLKNCYEDEVRRIEREIEWFKRDLKELDADGQISLTV
ncbi:MAG: hypothetical protein ACQET8_23005 [Bacillota bacterium]